MVHLDDVLKKIKQVRINHVEEEENQREYKDIDRYMYEIVMHKQTALEEKFRIINDNLTILDLPGINDGHLANQINVYLEDQIKNIVPIILIHLTVGEKVSKISEYMELFTILKRQTLSPTIIFTKFDRLIRDIKDKIIEEENEKDESEEKLSLE